VKRWFQAFAFKCNLYRYTEVVSRLPDQGRHVPHVRQPAVSADDGVGRDAVMRGSAKTPTTTPRETEGGVGRIVHLACTLLVIYRTSAHKHGGRITKMKEERARIAFDEQNACFGKHIVHKRHEVELRILS
jgi:hypothetical protein